MKSLLLIFILTFLVSNLSVAANQSLSVNPLASNLELTSGVENPAPNKQEPIESETKNASSTTWTGKAQSVAGRAQEVLINALSLTGIKYRYGGKSPETGFDCSGFVRYVFQQATNLTLPPTARAISQMGKAIAKDDLQPGDLVFFNTLKKTFSHVGIYIGNNRFIHSPSAGGVVRVDNLNTDYWSVHYNGAKRVDATSTDNRIN